MDVHPTKNVSIGIDPYPNEHSGISLSLLLSGKLGLFVHGLSSHLVGGAPSNQFGQLAS